MREVKASVGFSGGGPTFRGRDASGPAILEFEVGPASFLSQMLDDSFRAE